MDQIPGSEAYVIAAGDQNSSVIFWPTDRALVHVALKSETAKTFDRSLTQTNLPFVLNRTNNKRRPLRPPFHFAFCGGGGET